MNRQTIFWKLGTAIHCMIVLVFAFVFSFTANTSYGQRAAVGYDDLVAELIARGDTLEDGAGLSVMQAEAPAGGNYMAHAAGAGTGAHFSGKTFVEASGTSGVLGHARTVGTYFYGNLNSLAPGIADITGYDANDFLNTVMFNGGNDPQVQTFHVTNHSYVAREANVTVAVAEDLLARLDFSIDRDNTVVVVGADNGEFSATPRLWAPSFNSITVGLSDREHSQTATSIYRNPRFATEIVVPDVNSFTSNATPVVSGAAALLRDAGSGTNMEQNEVIRATLFAGATKEEFADWDRTVDRPLDEVFGFGELNIQNSYHIWEGGEFAGSTGDPATSVGLEGWDYGDFNGTDDLHYDFTINPGETDFELSAVLTWNLDVTDSDGSALFSGVTDLVDLNLELFDSGGSFLGSLIDSSFSSDYNHEHIFLTDLTAGDYTFRISGDAATDFGFAWRVNSVPEPGSTSVLGLMLVGLLARRRRG